MKSGKLKIALYLLLAIAGLAFAGYYFAPDLAKFLAEKRIAAATGMPTTIGALVINPSSSSIHLKDLKMQNSQDFGGGNFLEMPDLFLQYDPAALRSGRLLLKSVRIQITTISIVENPEGNSNIEALKQRNVQITPKPEVVSTNSSAPKMDFDGIELLNVSLGRVQFVNQRDPTRSWVGDLNIEEETFRNLKTELDFQTAMIVIILKAGLSGSIDFDTLWRKGIRPGKNPRPVPQNGAGSNFVDSANSRSVK